MNARWPSGRWDDKSVFSSSSWKHGHANSTLVQKPEAWNKPIKPSLLVDREGKEPSLAASGLDATGASVVLNFRGWKTVSTTVLEHKSGSDRFSYSYQPEWGTMTGSTVGRVDLYYLENKLEFLDVETEWYYDQVTRRLHVRTRNDEHPCKLRIQARTQSYAFMIGDTKHLVLQDLSFFATTIWAGALGHADSINGVIFDSLDFRFPHAVCHVCCNQISVLFFMWLCGCYTDHCRYNRENACSEITSSQLRQRCTREICRISHITQLSIAVLWAQRDIHYCRLVVMVSCWKTIGYFGATGLPYQQRHAGPVIQRVGRC